MDAERPRRDAPRRRPEDSLEGESIFSGPMGWDREAYSKVFVDPAQLDAAFMSANGAALDGKIGKYDDDEQKKLLDKFGELELLNMDAKKIDTFINPPPPKKAIKKAPETDAALAVLKEEARAAQRKREARDMSDAALDSMFKVQRDSRL